MYYFRLYRRFIVLEILRVAEYRMNFLLNIGVSLLQLLLTALTLVLLYRFTDRVAGWSAAELLLLLGIYEFMNGLIWLLFGNNMENISYAVRHGELDALLLRPVDSQFLMSVRGVGLTDSARILVGCLIVGYASHLAAISWEIGNLTTALALGLCGLLIFYSIWFALASCSLWWVQVDALDTLMYTALTTTRYPVSFYRGPLRTVLSFIIPIGFLVSFPTEALLGRSPAWLLPLGLILAIAGLIGSRSWWQYALRHYSSASS